MRISFNGFEVAELVRYNTLKPEDEQNRSKEYIDCKKEGQNDNYDITGEILVPECLNFDKDIKNHQRWQEQCTRQQEEVKRPDGGAVERKPVM